MSSKGEPKIRHTIRDDLRSPDLRDNLSRDYADLKENFLDDNKKEELKNMGRFRRFFKISWWLLKSMFFKMSPVRRLLLILGIFLIIASNTNVNGNGSSTHIPGAIILIFLLMLELKDKLLAKDELLAGHKVQNALMPEKNPDIKGWNAWLYTKAANDVGGDLIDYLKLTENKYGISIGDVAGKGLSAALIMAKLQATIRALAGDNKSLPEFASHINKIFHRDSLKNIFASLIYLEINEESDMIQLVNAGHMPPIIIKENELVELDKSNPALGLMKDVNFKEDNITLQKDEKVIFYSDGLVEAQNEDGIFFGDEKLKTVLKRISDKNAEGIGKYLIKVIDDYRGNARMTDDISIVVIEKN